MLAAADPVDLDNGPRAKPGTERMCALTRRVAPIDELLRFVVAPDGEVIADLKRNLPGRGLWLTCARTSVSDAQRRGIFAKNFKRPVKVSPDLASVTEHLMVRAVTDALAMAAKAGQVISGFSKVEDALQEGLAVALIHASDAAADGIRKLDAKLAGLIRENGGKFTDLPVIRALTIDELDLALGRSNVVHAALLAGPASKTVLVRCRTLTRFRMTADGEPDHKIEMQARRKE